MIRCLIVCLLVILPASAWAGVRLEAPAQVPRGEPFMVRVVSDQPLDNVHLTWGPMAVDARVTHDGGEWWALAMLGTGSDAKPGLARVRARVCGAAGEIDLEHRVRIAARKFPEEHLKVEKKMVHLSKAQLARHRFEMGEVRKAMENLEPRRLWDGSFVRPVPGGVSSSYGLLRFFNGEPRKPHSGVDLRGGEGTPVKAFAPGVVLLTGGFYFAGNMVYVDHGQGVLSVYAHLSSIEVERGGRVEAGQVVGKIGSTGRVTGPHLHFGVRVLGQWVDPMPLLD